MCGLTFIQDSIAEEGDLRMRSNGALARLHHRGPDGYGLFSGSGWAMGHKRLSIIDVAGSPQPMWDSDRRYCFTYNGEVYNYRELRLALEPEWKFMTRGDTEVVLAGLVLHGPKFLDRMEGMLKKSAIYEAQSLNDGGGEAAPTVRGRREARRMARGRPRPRPRRLRQRSF